MVMLMKRSLGGEIRHVSEKIPPRLSISLKASNQTNLARDEAKLSFPFPGRTFQRGRNRVVLNMRVHSGARHKGESYFTT